MKKGLFKPNRNRELSGNDQGIEIPCYLGFGNSQSVNHHSVLSAQFCYVRQENIELRFSLEGLQLLQSCSRQTAALVATPFRKASRSVLIVSASVVGIPCGKPL